MVQRNKHRCLVNEDNVPVKTRIDVEQKTVWFEAVETLTLEEVLSALDGQAASGAWSFRSVSDYSNITWVPLPDEIHRLVRHVEHLAERHGPRGLTALVVGKNMARFGMARMYGQMLGEQISKVAVFHSKEDALDWSLRPE